MKKYLVRFISALAILLGGFFGARPANFQAMGLSGIFGYYKLPYDADVATWTAGMDKRDTSAMGPFAAGAIYQGLWEVDGTPDELSFPRGDAITGKFYANLDPYQGTVVFWVTPEWEDDAFGSKYFFYNDTVAMRTNGAGSIVFSFHDTASWNHLYVDISGWVAGGTYNVVASWDSLNTIDGTNGMRVSVDDDHTYDVDVLDGGQEEPSATIHIGCSDTPGGGINALIHGFTMYRRVLWDGDYGVDINGGLDEVNAIWAAGAGADPCLTTGSWDVVFAMPTDSSTGALVTGEGEAWSHPYSSNVPEDWYLDDGYYGGAEHAIGFNATTTSIDFGSNATIDNIPAADYTVDFWCRLDSAGEGNEARVFEKGSVFFIRCGVTYLLIRTTYATSRGSARIPYTYDGKWHHVEAVYDQGTLSFEHFFIDGHDLMYGAVAGVGAYNGDVAEILYGGNRAAGDRCIDGDLGWLRFSDNKRHVADFIPPRAMPAVDGNTIEQWGMNDGTGANVVASVTSPACDGTLANGVWVHPWQDQGSPLDLQAIEYDGATTSTRIPDAVALQDLHGGAMCVEAWIRVDGWGENDEGRIFAKDWFGAGGWWFSLDSSSGLYAQCEAATDATAASGLDEFLADGKPHFVTMQIDWGGDKNIYLWTDGIPVDSYSIRQTGVGAVDTDVGNDLYYGNHNTGFYTLDGLLGPSARISNILRYTNGEAFVPPSPVNPWGLPDANTVWQTDSSDGAGLVLTDDSATGSNGVITMGAGRWWNTRDMDLNAIGEKVFPFGNMFGVDAANEGPHQTWTGLTAGWDYVARVTVYPSADGRGQARIVAYDEIGAVAITTFDGPTYAGIHSGANNSATLIAAAGKFPQSLIGAMVYNITDGSLAVITACSGDYTTITGGLAGGVDNDWDINDVFRIYWPGITEGFASHPWIETFCFELPAGCTSLSLRVLSASSEGFFLVGQTELLRQEITNPSLEGVYAGVPPIPPGWIDGNLDAGDTQASSTGGAVIHSGTEAIQFNVGAMDGEFIYYNMLGGVNSFYGWAGWFYGDGGVGLRLGGSADRVHPHYDPGTTQYIPTVQTAATWAHVAGVMRVMHIAPYPRVEAITGAAGARYADDIHVYELDNVSLTVTPASAANSAESGGIQVGGDDDNTQDPDRELTRYRGRIVATFIPRHEIALADSFGQPREYLFDVYEDANNYISAYRTANTVTVASNEEGAGEQTADWDATGVWDALDSMRIELMWGGAGARLRVEGVFVARIPGAVTFAADFTNDACIGVDHNGDNAFDGITVE